MLRVVDFAFDHVVVVVESLANAVREYRDAGFLVTPGGRHDAIPTENALVAFEDGGYLELIALRDRDARESLRLRRTGAAWERELRGSSAVARRFLPRLAASPGVADFVLCGAPLARFAAEARRRGFPMAGPAPMARERPDGTRLEWTIAFPAAEHIPFFIEDRTPRALRVPGGPEATAHPNGARGVAEVSVRVTDVPGAALAYADLFGVAPATAADSARLALAGIHVRLVAGEPAGACGAALRGDGRLPGAIEAAGVCFANARS
jgi:hypothetical protein